MSFEQPSPSLDRIKELCKLPENQGKKFVPVTLPMVADLDTPVSAFLKLRNRFKDTTSFLLESVSLGENKSRYSFLGTNAVRSLVSGGEDSSSYQGDPLDQLENVMNSEYSTISVPEITIPFTGGAVGYCSFDAVKHFEPSVASFIDKQTDVLKIPTSIYMIFDTIVVFDHAFQTLKLVTHMSLDDYNNYDKVKTSSNCFACFVLVTRRRVQQFTTTTLQRYDKRQQSRLLY